MNKSSYKDPNAVLDYVFDWEAWLGESDTIVSAEVEADDGLVVDSSSVAADGKSVTVWLSGGTAGASYDVVCHVVTADGREEDRTWQFRVKER